MCKKKEIAFGHIMTVEEVRASAIRAAARGRIEARARGTISALTGDGDPAWELKLREKIQSDIESENDPRGKFSR
ncbi:MAG: hypothetical protein WC503_06440 [Candidatus Shapirobacteria bacterium]